MTRDYEVNERIYERLLQRLEESKISQRLAEQERGIEQFRIIHPARPPEGPSGPNRPFLFILALCAGGGADLAGIVTRNYLDESYDDGDQLAEAFDVPCIAVIPRLDKVV